MVPRLGYQMEKYLNPVASTPMISREETTKNNNQLQEN